MPAHSPGEIQRMAAQLDMLVTRLRDDEYLLYDNETKQLLLGSQSGSQNRSGFTCRDSRGEIDGRRAACRRLPALVCADGCLGGDPIRKLSTSHMESAICFCILMSPVRRPRTSAKPMRSSPSSYCPKTASTSTSGSMQPSSNFRRSGTTSGLQQWPWLSSASREPNERLAHCQARVTRSQYGFLVRGARWAAGSHAPV
jgi:hypothetical protein